MLLVIVITFAEMMAMPFMNSYWIGRSKLHNRGQYAALYTMAWSVAQTLGPMLGAQVAEKQGFKALWWIVSGLSLFTAFGFARLHKYVSKKETADVVQAQPTDVELVAGSDEPLL
jgi:predicted MFS family arabinose efflux permease